MPLRVGWARSHSVVVVVTVDSLQPRRETSHAARFRFELHNIDFDTSHQLLEIDTSFGEPQGFATNASCLGLHRLGLHRPGLHPEGVRRSVHAIHLHHQAKAS